MKPYITTNGITFRVKKFPGLYLHNTEWEFYLNLAGILNPYLDRDYTFTTLKQANDALEINAEIVRLRKYKRLP